MSSLLSRRSKTAHISPALKTMSIRLLIDGQYRGNSSFLFYFIFFPVMISAWTSFQGLLLNLKVSCHLSDACWEKMTVSTIKHGGWSRLMLQRDARVGAQLQLLKLEVLRDNWAIYWLVQNHAIDSTIKRYFERSRAVKDKVLFKELKCKLPFSILGTMTTTRTPKRLVLSWQQ